MRAGDPCAALRAWIDEILSFGHDRAKAARIRVLGSPGAMRAEGYAEEMHHAARILTAPLEDCSGAVRPTDPSRWPIPPPTRRSIQSVVWAAAGLNPARDTPSSRAEAARQVRSFCERALGVTSET